MVARVFAQAVSIAGLVLCAAMLAIASMGLWVLHAVSDGGHAAYSVTGTSMEPWSHAGDLMLVDVGAEPEVGDVIVFWNGEGSDAHLICHRVVSRTYAEQAGVVTRGDNNDANDGFITSYRDIVGVVSMRVPNLGFLARMGFSECVSSLSLSLSLSSALVLVLLFTGGRLEFLWHGRRGDRIVGAYRNMPCGPG